ncbi:hypothetical protein ElyMa_005129300 [Elysia marginata]|uniref:Uncharacterized protein n=1 Tax=Elysia marginata TaxID=1093978 RepID=A0AAV4JKL9_9GAST|nr:hypothetical protein ElyMa_005129300 [Elysia marginata]
MSAAMSTTQDGHPSGGSEQELGFQSFHKRLLERSWTNMENRQDAIFKQNWTAGVDDQVIKDPKGNVIRVSTHRTEMKATFTNQKEEKKEGGCTIL